MASAILCAWPSLLVPSAQDARPLSREELERALQERDALIAELLQRVEALEQRPSVLESTASEVAPAPPLPAPKPVTTTAEVPAPTTTEEMPAPTTTAGVPAPPTTTAEVEAPAPGQFEIDEAAAERALDFTLVQEGALLLPFGRVEFSPSFTYTRRSSDFPFPVPTSTGTAVLEQEIRSNEFDFFGALRVGLPFDSQLELGLPYSIVDFSAVDQVNGGSFNDDSETGHGLGDITVGLAKTVLRQKSWWPDVVLRINWDTGSGEKSDNGVPLDGGFQSLTGSVSLAKRQDPLVFVAGASYNAAFEEDDLDPGDTLNFRIGTFLAASPSTSLYATLDQSFQDETEFDGRRIDGSDTVQSVLTLGASAVLGRDVLIDGNVGVGLTDDSPDYLVSVSLPIRFNLPAF